MQGRPQISGAAKIAEMIHGVHEIKEETQMHGSGIIDVLNHVDVLTLLGQRVITENVLS